MASNNLDFLLNLRANTSGFDQGINGAKFAVNALVGAMAALGVGLGVKELAEAADSYAMLSAKIQQSTKESGNFQQAMAGVHQIALNTNSSLDATAGLFTKLNTVAKDMGQTQQYALDMTSTVTKAIQLGGGSAQASEAAVQQFIQAMQGGVLRGEEFNSIMENGYGLAEALAKGLGVTTGELRKMAEAGELSAERVLGALAKQKAGVDAQYAELPLTISNALQKIATSWQILIGEMDQANGASATVAQALSAIADNLDILKIFFDDVANGVGWFKDQLSKIDTSTIEALRSTLSQAYDTIKVIIANVAEFGVTAWSSFNSALDAVSPLFAVFLGGSENVSGLTTMMNLLKIAMAAVGDLAYGLNIGFKVVLAAVQFLSGGIYSLASATLDYIPFMGKLADEAENASDRMFEQAEKNMRAVGKLAQDHKWAVIETYKEINKTRAEKDAETVTSSKATLDKLLADQNAEVDGKKASEGEKLRAVQEYAEAAIKANSGVMDGTMQADLMTKGYIVTLDEAGKVAVNTWDAAATGANKTSNETDKARKAAAALGLDLDRSLNRVSEKFSEGRKNVDDFSAGLNGLGASGKQAAELTYEAWRKWLETAKSQSEIDAAKAKIDEFEKKGVFSTKQVEMGMLAIKQVTAKLPDDLDEVGKAFDRLGIKTKEQLQLAAQSAIADFNTIKASGQATSEGLKQAYERVMQAAAASGDQAVIANAKAQGASVGLQAQIDETGKSSVKSTQEIVDALYGVEKTARGSTADGFRELGRVAREEAKSTADEWLDAMAKVDADRKAKAAETAKGLGQLADGQNQMAQNFYDQLIAGGMEKGRAEELKNEAITRMNNQLRTALNGGSASGAFDAKIGRNESQAWMQEILDGLDSKGTIGSSSPKISAPNIEAPSIQQFKMPNIDIGSPKNVRIELVNGNNSTTVYGDEQEADFTEKFFRELEQAKKRM